MGAIPPGFATLAGHEADRRRGRAQEGNRDYLKFLIQEATSVFEHHVDFKAPDGTQFRLVHDVRTGEFRVEKKAT